MANFNYCYQRISKIKILTLAFIVRWFKQCKNISNLMNKNFRGGIFMRKKSYVSPEVCLSVCSTQDVLAISGGADGYYSDKAFDIFW